MLERIAAFAPGRANLIGEHTDYNSGLSLPFALAQGTTVTGRRRRGNELVARSDAEDEPARFSVRFPDDDRRGDWRDFVRGAIGELLSEGVRLPGAELEIESTLPEGAGLSSSAALSVALCSALLALAGHPDPDPLWLARMCSRVESNWVGVATGLLDQLASLLGREDGAVRIDFRTLETTHVPLQLDEWRLVGIDSGERHQLSASGYGERRRECEQAAEMLGLESLRDASPGAWSQLPDPLGRRVRHVVEENARVNQAVTALRERALPRVGDLLNESHASLRDQFEVSTERVEATVGAVLAGGAAGARLMGGGFGGTVIALLPPGVDAPSGAIALRPSNGARLL